MTRKDYVKIAAVLNETRGAPQGNGSESDAALFQWTQDVAAIAYLLAADNPRFDRARFYKACGMEDAA